ncbi:MAG: hypothetical protein HZA15_15945 [Nitrospirae bacterium]|nr:hypothetical protein [Nitrospirota bacterium]
MQHKIRISFSYKRIGIPELENILSKYWESSLEASLSEITFDLSHVEFIDLPQLCFLFLWVEQLLKNQKSITLLFQHQTTKNSETSKIIGVFQNYGFISCLSSYEKFKVVPSYYEKSRDLVGAKHHDSPIIHLTSIGSRERLSAFITDLDPQATDPILTVAKREREILNRTGVRDIFLKELGLNVFEHAEGTSAIVAVSKKTIAQLGYSSNPVPVKEFARQRKSTEYIQVVVADFGPGIPKKLKHLFDADRTAHDQLDPRSESSLVEYAFWKDVTSKPRRALDEILDAKAEEFDEHFIPPTGLYFVENLVKKHKGFLYVRTAGTILGFNYASGDKVIVEPASWRSKNEIKGPLVTIPGTMIVVVIPLDAEELASSRKLFGLIRNKKPGKVTSYINAENLTLEIQKSDEKKMAVMIIEEIKKDARRLKAGGVLLVDFSNFDLSAKYIYKIILFAMYMQTAGKLVVFADISPTAELNVVIQEIIGIAKNRPHLLPIIYCDSNTKEITIIGDNPETSFSGQELFDYTLDPNDLQNALQASKDSVLQKQLDATFYQDEKVFLPSQVYIKGYFELADLLGHPFYSKKIADKIVSIIPRNNYIAIIATAGNLSRFAREVATNLNLPSDYLFFSKGETTPVSALFPIQLRLKDTKEGAVLLLSDVVVTGRSVNKIAELLSCPVVVAAVIDARPPNATDPTNLLSIVCIKRHSFELHFERPSKWKYEDIRLVDPISHKLVFYEPCKTETLLDSESYLDAWVVTDQAMRCGHYHYSDVHVNYFFHTYRICEKYRNVIVERIRADVEIILAHGNKVTHVCYPEENKAAEGLCVDLQTYIGGKLTRLPRIADPDRTLYSVSRTMLRQDAAKIMVFIDMAATTCKTMQYAMELASALDADKLLLYVVINRIAGRWPQAFEHIRNFRGVEVHIKSLVKAELPAHTPRECPLCDRRSLMDSYSTRFLPSRLRLILRELSENLRQRSIKELREESERVDYEGAVVLQQVRFRDQIEREVKSVTYVVQRNLIDQVNAGNENKILGRGIISCLALEGEVLLGEGRYENLLNSEFLEAVFNLALTIGTDINQPLQDRTQAIWVACLSNYTTFLRSLVTLAEYADNDLIIKHLIAATITYSGKSSAQNCCEALERALLEIQQSRFAERLSADSLTALSEAVGYYRFSPEKQQDVTESFTEAFRVLNHVLDQPGRTHPDIRRVFDTSVKVVEPEGLTSEVEQAYLGASGFFETMTTKILPSLRRLTMSYPDEVLLDVRYLTDQGDESLLADLRELDLHVRTSLYQYANRKLTEIRWRHSRERVKVVAERIRNNFLSTDKGVLRKLLTRSRCTVAMVVPGTIEQLLARAREKNITITKNLDAAAEIIIVPPQIVADILLTILENALDYSEEKSTILVQAFSDNRGVCISIESSPLPGYKPEVKESHGLSRALALLNKIDGKLTIDDTAYKQEMIARISVSLVTERRALHNEF